MIGQTNLRNKLKAYTLKNFPKSNLIIGLEGCGKHLLLKELSDYYKTDLIEITSDYNIEDIELSVRYAFYFIDLSNIELETQNKLLKLIEEPPKYSIFFILSTNINNVISTIKNRCIEYNFDSYSLEELKSIRELRDINNYKYCTTPGQLLKLNESQIEEIKKLSNIIIDKIEYSHTANILKLSHSFNFKNEDNKIDIRLFFNILLKDYQEYKLLKLTNHYLYLLDSKLLNKEDCITGFLLDLYDIKRGE